MGLGERLKTLRGAASQEDLSKHLDVSKAAIGAYERNTQMPGSAFIISACEHFNVEHRWLLTGKGPMRTGEPPQPAANAPEPPANKPETVNCARCAKLEAKVEKVEGQRDELAAENRQLMREIADLRVEAAVQKEQLRALSGRNVVADTA